MTNGPNILLVHPGATYSTHDVFVGMRAGLEACGCTVTPYPLDTQLQLFEALIDGAISAETIDRPIHPMFLAGEALMGHAVHYQPDAVIAISGGNVYLAHVMLLRELAAQVNRRPFPVAVYCTESPYAEETVFARAYDVVFTNERTALGRFPQNERVHYLPLAYNPAVHRPGPVEPDLACDVCFVGTGFPERRALFDAIDWPAEGIRFTRQGFLWHDADRQNLLTPADVTANVDTVRLYRSAAISVNVHRTTTTYGSDAHIPAGAAESLNPRDYEIPAAGGFLLSDDARPELRDLYGDAVPTFRASDPQSLLWGVRYWLAHPAERERLRLQQQALVAPHTWAARASHVLTTLLKET